MKRARGPGRPRGKTLTRDDVVEAGVRCVEQNGAAALGVNDVARELGIKPASLYNHVNGSPELRGLVASEGYFRLLRALRAEVPATATARTRLLAFARAYRTFARCHPQLYASMTASPLPDGPAKEELRRVVLELLGAPLHELGVPRERAVDAIRALRSALVGFVQLELAREFEFSASADASFEYLTESLLSAWSRTP